MGIGRPAQYIQVNNSGFRCGGTVTVTTHRYNRYGFISCVHKVVHYDCLGCISRAFAFQKKGSITALTCGIRDNLQRPEDMNVSAKGVRLKQLRNGRKCRREDQSPRRYAWERFTSLVACNCTCERGVTHPLLPAGWSAWWLHLCPDFGPR